VTLKSRLEIIQGHWN